VPVGVEKLLYLAARDDGFKRRLLDDRAAAIEESGTRLRPSEAAALDAIDSATLERMIGSIVPENPRRRKFMGLVAAAATSLAAGTAVISCDGASDDMSKGATGDTDVDGDTDTDSSTNTDTVSDSDTIDTNIDTETATQGVKADVEIDGVFEGNDSREREE
jgi:hypothetical protein